MGPFGYDLAAAGLAAAVALAVYYVLARRPATADDGRHRHFLAAGLHLSFILFYFLLFSLSVLALKKGGDTINAIHVGHNIAHGSLANIPVQIEMAQGYNLPLAAGNVFSRGFSLIPFAYGALYALGGNALAFLLLAGLAEILVVYGAGWLLYRQFAGIPGAARAALLFLLAYDLCFVNALIVFKELNLYTWSLLTITAYFIALIRRQPGRAALWFIVTVLLKEIHLPLLAFLAFWVAGHGFLRLRYAILFSAGGALLLLFTMHVIIPLTGTEFAMGREPLLPWSIIGFTFPLYAALIVIAVVLSAGTLLRDPVGLLGCVVVLLVPFLYGKMLEWNDVFGAYVRFIWPIPFFALFLRCRREPQRALPLAAAALAAGLVLSYALGPFPLARTAAHVKSPGNLERFRPMANFSALEAAIGLIPPAVPFEASATILQRTADRAAAFPLKYYRFIGTNPLKQQQPPEYLALDCLATDLLTADTEQRQVFYGYVAAQIAGEYRTSLYHDCVLLLQRLPGRAQTATDSVALHDLARLAVMPQDEFHQLTAANRFNQPQRLRLLLDRHGIVGGATPAFTAPSGK